MKRNRLLIWVVLVLSLAALVPYFDQGIDVPSRAQKGVAVTDLNSKPEVISTVPDDRTIATVSTPTAHDQIEFAQSLQGTEIDGSLRVGADGLLILDQGVRDFFDYFLSAADELGPEAAIAEVRRYIDDFLPESAAIQAHNLFANYLRYKKFEFELQQTPLNGAQLDADSLQLVRENFESLRDKRSRLFNDQEDEALFGLEQIYQEYTLSTLELFADQTITDEDRMDRLAGLEAALPSELRASRSEDANHRVEQVKIQELSINNADDVAFHQALTDQGLTQDKVDELVAYRQQQQGFEKDYLRYRKAVLRLDPEAEDYQSQLNRVQTAFFNNPEDITKARLLDLSKE